MRALAVAIGVFLGVAGCASTPKGTVGVAAHSLLGTGEAAAQQWEAALQRWQQQPGEDTAQALREAGPVFQQAAQRCAQTSGCDASALFSRYGDLLAQQSSVLLGDDETRLSVAGEHAGDGTATGVDGETTSPLVDDVPALDATITLLKGRELRDVIVLNKPVNAALNEWLTWMRPQLIEAYENYQFLRHRMWPEYEKAGLPEALLFGILAKESAGKVHAVSSAGAAGPLQFMPATGQRFGLGRNAQGFDTRFDPQLAARANVAYLNERFATFNDDLALALAAYNGGEGRMTRLYRQSRHKSFWDPALYSRLPGETRDYVPMVLAAAWLFLHPQDYGLEFPQVDASASELVLQQAASINQLAVCLGQQGTRSGWFRALRNLNPQYLPHIALPAGSALQVPAAVLPAYAANCLQGERASLAIAVAKAAIQHPASGASSRGYTVRRGDTLAAISRRHQCQSPATLAAANGIKPPAYLIRPGQSLRLQGCRA